MLVEVNWTNTPHYWYFNGHRTWGQVVCAKNAVNRHWSVSLKAILLKDYTLFQAKFSIFHICIGHTFDLGEVHSRGWINKKKTNVADTTVHTGGVSVPKFLELAIIIAFGTLQRNGPSNFIIFQTLRHWRRVNILCIPAFTMWYRFSFMRAAYSCIIPTSSTSLFWGEWSRQLWF